MWTLPIEAGDRTGDCVTFRNKAGNGARPLSAPPSAVGKDKTGRPRPPRSPFPSGPGCCPRSRRAESPGRREGSDGQTEPHLQIQMQFSVHLKKKKKKTKCFLTGRISLSRNKLREQDDFRQHQHRRSCMWAECGPRRPTEAPRMPRMSFRLSRRAGD